MRPRPRIRRSTLRLAAHWILSAPLSAGAAPLVAIVASSLTPTLAAQRLPLAADSAAVLSRGMLRVGLGGTHATARDRYVDGTLEGIGGPLTSGALGPIQFPLLGSIESEIRALGLTTFAASLGRSRLDARQRLFVTPLAIEYGLTDRWTIGVSTSLVRTRAETQFRLRGDSGLATLGRNPIALGSAVATNNATTIGAFSSAALSLTSRRDGCIANPLSAPECPTILAEAAQVSSLIGLTSDFADRLTTVYGAGLVAGAPYVPMAGSAAEVALLARVDSLRVALVRYGVANVTPTTGLPLGAQSPLSAEDLTQLIRDPVRGFGAKPLEKGGLTALGDIHFAATFRVHDGLTCRSDTACTTPTRGLRQSVRLGFDLSTGARRRADRLLDQGTGAGFDAIVLRSLTDVALSRRVSGSLVLGVTSYLADDVRMRVPSIAVPGFLEAWRMAVVPVTPGLLLEFGLAPRLRLSENFVLGLDWQWRQQASSRHAIDSATVDPRGAAVGLEGSALDALSAWSEQRAGFSATYSMLPAVARGLRRAPIDITFTHAQTLFGHSGTVVKRWQDHVVVRYYTRLRGR